MQITKRTYASPKGEITIFRLENAGGSWVELSTLGAGVAGVAVPDRNDKIEEVALNYADPADYLYDGPCLGKCPGRYANRIVKGHLEVEGNVYQLAINNGPNALHGGPEGFQNQIWKAREIDNGVEFSYDSVDGEENYPGNLKAKATYTWNDKNELTLHLEATTDKDTVINLTNHSYWNLEGSDKGPIFDHEMKMKASRWLPTDDTQIPTGELAPVIGTPMDFVEFKAIGKDIKNNFEALKIGKGYDHCWAFDGWKPGQMIDEAVILRDAKSGRTLSIDTDQPGAQVYTGNWLEGCAKSRAGKGYHDYEGVAIEMQDFPDAPNKPEFPSTLLKPGEKYDRTIKFRFGTF